MLFSIIVPVYNTEKYLEGCLESILNQNFSDYEIILVNDGSTDSSPELCEHYAMRDERIRVIHKANGGVSSARNCGIEIAKGNYIWFVDSDDTIVYEALQILSEYIKEEPDLIVFNAPLQKKYRVDSLETFLREHYFKYHLGFAPWNKLYKREIIEQSKMRFDTQETIGEDLLFNIMYYQHVCDIKFVEKKLYNYVVRENSAMTSVDSQRYIKQMRLFDKIYSIMGERVSKETILCLYFMHLVSGINQTSNNQLKMRERSQIIRQYYQQYMWNKEDYCKGFKQFLMNENASFLGKVKAYLLYGYWRVR